MLPLVDPGPIANTNVVGWTCAICRMWVSGEGVHFCGGSSDASPNPLYVDPVLEKLDRIIKLLEGIDRRTK